VKIKMRRDDASMLEMNGWIAELRDDDHAEPAAGVRAEPAAGVRAELEGDGGLEPGATAVAPRANRLAANAEVSIGAGASACAEITEPSAIGDQLRIPIAWCEMGSCISHHADRAALGEADIRARAVVLAAGGFESNLEWLEEIWGEAARNFIIRGTPYNTGTVLRLMLDAGADPVGDPSQCHAVAIDARAPKFDGGIVTRLDSVPFGIVVNKHGDRFYDEGEDYWPKRYAIWGRLDAQQPDQKAYSLIET
jgi:precorrin 3B synthase CobZ